MDIVHKVVALVTTSRMAALNDLTDLDLPWASHTGPEWQIDHSCLLGRCTCSCTPPELRYGVSGFVNGDQVSLPGG